MLNNTVLTCIRRILITVACVTAPALSAQTLSVAVAANFTAPMQEIAQAFKAETGHDVSLSFGSTGKFYAQIHHGAPFEILFSADTATPAKLIQDGLGIADSLKTYAIGALVLWSAQPTLIQDGPKLLASGNFNKLALADPRLAPYGLAAQQTLQHLGLAQQVQSKLVTAENISQAYQFVATGNAELGFVAMSQVYANGALKSGSVWIVPETDYQPILQDALILKKGQENPLARTFMQFLQSESAKRIILSYGYRLK